MFNFNGFIFQASNLKYKVKISQLDFLLMFRLRNLLEIAASKAGKPQEQKLSKIVKKKCYRKLSSSCLEIKKKFFLNKNTHAILIIPNLFIKYNII